MHFDLVDVDFTVLIRIAGEPDDVRRALRAACSHRRRIVVSQGPEYFSNVIGQLTRMALDTVQIWAGKEAYHYEKLAHQWNYRVTLQGHRRTPYIHYHSQGKDETHCPLFQFLGTEQIREYEWTEARLKRKGGRPKEKWLRDNLFEKVEMPPAKKAWYRKIAAKREARRLKTLGEHKAITSVNASAAGSSKALGLKHTGRRIIPVDFSKMHTAIGSYDQDAEFNEVWEDSLTPAERAEGPGA